MRILLLADAGSTTGFARVSHEVGDRLSVDYGHEIHCLAVNYDGDAGRWVTALKLYRPDKFGGDIYGTRRYVEMLGEVMPDLVWMINDPFVILKHLFRNRHDPELRLVRTRPIVAYMPVDGTNQPPTWSRIPEFVSGVEPVHGGNGCFLTPVAMSEFGGKFLGTSDVIYHGIDSETYHPIEEGPITLTDGSVISTKAEAKALFGIPEDAFLVLRVDRNSARKNYADTWRALVPVMKEHSNVHAWFHCKGQGDHLELPSLMQREPDVASRFHWPGQYDTRHGWPEAEMSALYAAADLFVSTSWGEGFGLTLGEAAAAGVPIVAQNVSSIPEVVGPGGVLLEPERLTATESGQDQWLPDVKAFTDAIDNLYGYRKLRQRLGQAGRAHVQSQFTWDTAARQFDELFTRVAQEAPETHIREDETPHEDQVEDDGSDPG